MKKNQQGMVKLIQENQKMILNKKKKEINNQKMVELLMMENKMIIKIGDKDGKIG